MSRIGKKPIPVPAGVEVNIAGNVVTVKGPKGTLTVNAHRNMKVALENGEIIVTRPNDDKENRALHGLTRSLIANMVEGVTNGFKKELEINGVGYRAAAQGGKKITLNVGYSHPVDLEAPAGGTVETPAPNKIVITGADKQAVGEFAAQVRKVRPPEPYHGKGIKYYDEVIRRKEGKAGKGGK